MWAAIGIGTVVLFAAAVWASACDREIQAWRHRPKKVVRPCYHGVARHDLDWEV